jgi:hypothetical protein
MAKKDQKTVLGVFRRILIPHDPLLNTIKLGAKISTYAFSGDTNIQSIKILFLIGNGGSRL